MKHWKRIICIVTVALFGILAAACTNTGNSTSATEKIRTEERSSASDAEKANGKRVLVAYYSASGNTKEVAKTAAETLGADIYELTPVHPYTDADLNYRDKASRISKEHDDPNRYTELANPTPPNFADYDVVLIGAPMWWHEAAWTINDFLTKNDFTGKSVVPFVTSYSDPLGDSGKKMEALAGTGNWQEGMRFSGTVSKSDVETWAKGLKFWQQ